MRIIILTISDNISTSNREHFENKQVTYILHYSLVPPKVVFRGRQGEVGEREKKKKICT